MDEFIVTAVCSGCGNRMTVRRDFTLRKHSHRIGDGFREIEPGTVEAMTVQEWHEFRAGQRRSERLRILQEKKHARASPLARH